QVRSSRATLTIRRSLPSIRRRIGKRCPWRQRISGRFGLGRPISAIRRFGRPAFGRFKHELLPSAPHPFAPFVNEGRDSSSYVTPDSSAKENATTTRFPPK